MTTIFKKIRRTNRLQGRKLQFESMENRRLLAGDLFHYQRHTIRQSDHGVSALVSSAATSQKSASASAVGTNTVYATNLTNSITGATANVVYKSGMEHGVANTELNVHVSKQAANITLDVMVGGVTVGSIATDANGNGQLELESNADNAHDLSLPANFPTVAAGTKVQFGADTGTLTVPTITNPLSGDHGHGDRDGHDGNHSGNEAGETRFVSRMQGTGIQVGTVKFETETHGTTTSSVLEISVRNLTPNATLDVIINSVTVGQITTDATGRGKLELSSTPHGTRELPLPANMPVIAAGSTVQIGTELSGTFIDPTTVTVTPKTTTGTTSTGTKTAPAAVASATQVAVTSANTNRMNQLRRSNH